MNEITGNVYQISRLLEESSIDVMGFGKNM